MTTKTKVPPYKVKDGNKLYLAYGSNLKVKDMRFRCPGAKPLGRLMLSNVRLVFRGCADLDWNLGEQTPVGIWEITPRDEEKLDRYEGVSFGLYAKFMIRLPKPYFGKTAALIYLMTDREGIYPPSAWYVSTIRDGYKNFKLDEKFLDAAVEHSFDEKNPSEQTISRRARQLNSSHQKELVKIPLSVQEARVEAARKLHEQRAREQRVEQKEGGDDETSMLLP